MNINVSVRNYFLTLSTINFDELFYNSITGKNILFKDVFPSGNYAIVGNSPILLEGNNGVAIDKADYVVRFNNFQVQQFENSVGTKTDMWITGGGIQSPNALPSYLTQKKILFLNQSKSFKDKQLKIIEKYSIDNLSSFIIFHNDNFLNKVSSLIQGVPTTGFLILLLLVTQYKNINTYGFSFGKHIGKYHYYKDNVIQDSGHKWSKELEIFKILLSKKLLINSDVFKKTEINFYKNTPRHIKRLYTQRNQNFKNQTNPIYPTYQTNPTYKNTQTNSSYIPDIVQNTNNQLIELSKLLQ